MKKYLFSIIFLLVSYLGFSQKGLSYQAVVLDPNAIEIPGQDISGQPLVNGDVWMKFSIYNGSTLQFEEVQKTKTDAYGLVNLLIGSVSTSSFNALVWDASQKTLQVHVSFNQGASYTKVSDQKLNYNPYALYAETAGKLGSVLSIAGGGTGATTAVDARLNLGLGNVDNTSDSAKPVSTATKAALDLKANVADVNSGLALKVNSTDVTAALALKANTTDMTAALAAKADTGTIKTFVVTQVAAATIADADASTKGKIQLAGDLAGTADAPTVPALALKANTSDVTTALALKANASDVTTALALKANASDVTTALAAKADNSFVVSQIAGATIVDADANTKGKIKLAGDLGGTAVAPTVPGLALKANAADVTSALTLKANTSDMNTALALKANTSSLSTVATSGDYNDLSNKPTIPSAYSLPVASASTLGGVKVGSNLSIDANGTLSAIASNNASSFSGTLPLANGGTGVTDLNSLKTIIGLKATKTAIGDQAGNSLQGDGAVGVGSGAGKNNQGGSSIAIGNVAGENNQGGASVAIGPNAAQSGQGSSAVAIGFAAGQNNQGANSVALGAFAGNSQAANSIAINANGFASPLNPTTSGFYVAPIRNASTTNPLFYDSLTKEITYGTASSSSNITLTTTGTGSATLSGTTLNIPTPSTYSLPTASGSSLGGVKVGSNLSMDGSGVLSANINAGSISGTVAVANGGTGATTLTGLIKGNGTNALTAAVAGTDYQAPITLTTTGTGSATLSGTTLNIPTPSTYSLPTASGSSLGGVKVGSNLSMDGSGVLSANINAGSISGTVAVANGGTGATTLTGLVKGNGTNALTAAVAGTDYQAPITLTTTGTGAATLSGTTLNIPTPSSAGSTAHSVGETFDGGIVFYVTLGGYHGLIVDEYIYDGNPEYMYSDVKNPLKHSLNNSARLFTDWRIPTYQELVLLYNARSNSTIASLTNNKVLMSSDYMKWTQASPYRCLKFSDGTVEWINGDWVRHVIAIRSF